MVDPQDIVPHAGIEFFPSDRLFGENISDAVDVMEPRKQILVLGLVALDDRPDGQRVRGSAASTVASSSPKVSKKVEPPECVRGSPKHSIHSSSVRVVMTVPYVPVSASI